MPLTDLQRMVARVIRPYRSISNFVGGGAALNRRWSRISDDLDLYTESRTLPQSALDEVEALRRAGFSVDVIVANDSTVEAIVKQYGFDTRLQWMDDPEISKRFFPATDDEELGFRLHEADNAVNKVLCAARRNRAARDAADLVTIVEQYAPLGPLVWAVCGKDERLTPVKVIRDIQKIAFGYADEEFRTLGTDDATSFTRDRVRRVLTRALDEAAAYCDDIAPPDLVGWLFVDAKQVPMEATAEQLDDKTAFAMPLKHFRAMPTLSSAGESEPPPL